MKDKEDISEIIIGYESAKDFFIKKVSEGIGMMFKCAIDACKSKKYVGMCVQVRSDYPEVIEFLVKNGIDSLSLNPDSIIAARDKALEVEREIKSKGNF